MKKYNIDCPCCGTTFECESQLNVWKDELIGKINEIVKEWVEEQKVKQ